jgi:NADH-quinone oxidoreductase subunit M
MDWPILSLITFLPLAAIPIIALLPPELKGSIRGVTLATMLVGFAVSVYLFFAFDGALASFQFVEEKPWIMDAIKYKLGVDGISLLLVLLTTFITPVAFLAAYGSVQEKVKEFSLAMLVLETAMIGTFLALDMFLFYVFWELMLLPMYLLIGVWGGPQRIYATVKFVVYTMAGSVLMLVAILFVYWRAGAQTFDYNLLLETLVAGGRGTGIRVSEQIVLFLAFGLAFAIKVPLFPLHTWLPDAHVEAPTAGSVILAGVLLKMGTYGFLRFAIPLFPEAAATLSGPVMALAVAGIVYGALVAYAQKDIKRLVAYSSVSHLGLVILGMFALTPEGIQGSILQMVNHGLSTGALFLCVGMLYERRHTRMMEDFGGLARVMPVFSVLFLIVILSSIAMPGTNGFVGELLILFGVFKEGVGTLGDPDKWLDWRTIVLALGVLATTGVVLGAVYMLTMARRVLFGAVTKEENRQLGDVTGRELAVLLPVLALVLIIGLFPAVFLDKTRGTVDEYVRTYQPRIMQKRSPSTLERQKLNVRDLLRKQMQQELERIKGGGMAPKVKFILPEEGKGGTP